MRRHCSVSLKRPSPSTPKGVTRRWQLPRRQPCTGLSRRRPLGSTHTAAFCFIFVYFFNCWPFLGDLSIYLSSKLLRSRATVRCRRCSEPPAQTVIYRLLHFNGNAQYVFLPGFILKHFWSPGSFWVWRKPNLGGCVFIVVILVQMVQVATGSGSRSSHRAKRRFVLQVVFQTEHLWYRCVSRSVNVRPF